MASVESESIHPREVTYRLLKAIRGSLLLFFVANGVVLLFFAIIFESSIELTQQDGVIAGILGVFGISAIVFAGSSYAILKSAHRRMQS